MPGVTDGHQQQHRPRATGNRPEISRDATLRRDREAVGYVLVVLGVDSLRVWHRVAPAGPVGGVKLLLEMSAEQVHPKLAR